MSLRSFMGLMAMLFTIAGAAVAPAAERLHSPEKQAVEKALAFLESEAIHWKQEHRCLSCFNLAMTMPSVPSLDPVSRQELDLMAGDIVRHQEADGSWSGMPPGNGPPPVFESTEVMTLRSMLALETYVAADPSVSASSRACLEKASLWLKQTRPADTTQTSALRLLVEVQTGKRGKGVGSGIKALLKRQNADGGFGPTLELPSDAYATGQALYALSLAGVRNNRTEIERARAFLITTQRPDGSWLMVPRAHPGKTPFKNPAPIIYFGSSWATLGLLRTMPEELTRREGE